VESHGQIRSGGKRTRTRETRGYTGGEISGLGAKGGVEGGMALTGESIGRKEGEESPSHSQCLHNSGERWKTDIVIRRKEKKKEVGPFSRRRKNNLLQTGRGKGKNRRVRRNTHEIGGEEESLVEEDLW